MVWHLVLTGGAPWESSLPPPTEYFLEISQLQSEIYDRYQAPLPESTCHKCRAVSLDADLERAKNRSQGRAIDHSSANPASLTAAQTSCEAATRSSRG